MSNYKLLLGLLLTFISVFSARAQNSVPTIEVTGSATLNIVPDRITIEIGIEEYFKQSLIDSTKVKLSSIEKEIRKAVKKSGINENSITVADLGNYRDRSMSNKFLMAQRLSLVLTDFNQLETLASELPAQGVTSFRITNLDNSDMMTYNRKGLKAALEAAKEKAGFIAEIDGLTTPVPWEIVENFTDNYGPSPISNVAYTMGDGMENMRCIIRRYSVRVKYICNQ